MNPKLAQINAHITLMVNDPQNSYSLRPFLQQNYPQKDAEWLDNYANFLQSYIQFAPGNLATMWQAANAKGKSAEMDPIADMLIAYFFKGDDHIPDRLGLWGWLDDAYLCNYTLELINQKCMEQFGYYLIDFDFNKCNNTAAPFLGDVIHALQKEAAQAVNNPEIWTAVATLAVSLLGGLLLYSLFGGDNVGDISIEETYSPVDAQSGITSHGVVTDESLARQQAELSRMQYNSRSADLIGLGSF